MYESISIEELKQIMRTNQYQIILIDIREKYQFLLGHMEGAQNIPKNFLLMMPEEYLEKEKNYYLYCEHGVTSKRVCEELSLLGYKVINVDGGYQAYRLS